jgi:ABC-type sugar transport system permease subunit
VSALKNTLLWSAIVVLLSVVWGTILGIVRATANGDGLGWLLVGLLLAGAYAAVDKFTRKNP